MSGTCPAIIDRATIRSRSAPMSTVLLALLLAGCGSDRSEEELMRRVVAAEAAAASADAARVQAEQTLANFDNAEADDEGELSENFNDPVEDEQVAELAPNDQDTGGEMIAPPAPEPAPQAQVPA